MLMRAPRTRGATVTAAPVAPAARHRRSPAASSGGRLGARACGVASPMGHEWPRNAPYAPYAPYSTGR